MTSIYYQTDKIEKIATDGDYRAIVGGMWDEMGDHQMDMLKSRGLKPGHRLLDVGCGALRLGRKAVPYLSPGNYWGTDLVWALMAVGYEREIVAAGLGNRLPAENLVVDMDFTFKGLPAAFDFVVAQSVFTHLPLNHMRLCLANLSAHLHAPATFLFTIFEPGPDVGPADSFRHATGGVVSHPHRDPFHYRRDDVIHAARGLPWELDFVGDWGHPRDQQLVVATLTR